MPYRDAALIRRTVYAAAASTLADLRIAKAESPSSRAAAALAVLEAADLRAIVGAAVQAAARRAAELADEFGRD